MKKHVVKADECISSIAFEHGFFWRSLWDLPQNSELKARRSSPFVLEPGDVVCIPELRARSANGASGFIHTFRRLGVPAQLHLRLRVLGQPLANLPYELEITGGTTLTGTTGTEGEVDVFVPPDTPRAILRVGAGDDAMVYDLTPRTLNPVESINGTQSRLANLGYYSGPLHGRQGERIIT